MISIRASSTDRALVCATSMAPCETPYNPNSPEANEGTAGHEALESIPLEREPDIDGIAQRYGVDADQLAALVATGRKAWDEVKKVFPHPQPERTMRADLGDGVELTGTSDLVSVSDDGEIAILDWKLGWRPTEHPAQLKSYALLARETHGMPARGSIRGYEIWVRAREIRSHEFGAVTLDDHRDALVRQAGHVWRQYGPSAEACRYCPRQLVCSARSEYARGAATALGEVAEQGITDRALIGRLYDKSRELARLLRQYDDAVDAMLDDGPLELGDGRKLVRVVEERDALRVSAAMPYLREVLKMSASEADEALSLSKSGLQKVIKGRAAKGRAAAMMRETMDALRERGAVETTTIKTKRIEKP